MGIGYLREFVFPRYDRIVKEISRIAVKNLGTTDVTPQWKTANVSHDLEVTGVKGGDCKKQMSYQSKSQMNAGRYWECMWMRVKCKHDINLTSNVPIGLPFLVDRYQF